MNSTHRAWTPAQHPHGESREPVSLRPPGGLWLEQLAADGRVVHRLRCLEMPLRAGAGYAHHVVIDGCRVPDSAHLLFTRSPRGTLLVQVVGGPAALLGRSLIGPEPAPLFGSATLQWAGATLRVVEPCPGSLAEEPSPEGTLEGRPRVPAPFAALLFGLVPALGALGAWLAEPRPQPPWQHLLAQVPIFLGLMAWWAAWVFACRAIAGRAAWRQHLAIGAGGAFAWAVAQLAGPPVLAALGVTAPPGAAEAAGLGWAGIVAAAHIGPFALAARPRRAWRGLFLVLALGMAAASLAPGWLDDDPGPRVAASTPPGWQWRAAVAPERWLAELRSAEPIQVAQLPTPLPGAVTP